jgi:hypothetical protein
MNPKRDRTETFRGCSGHPLINRKKRRRRTRIRFGAFLTKEKTTMHIKHWLPVAGIVALGFMAVPAGAAALSGVGNLSLTASANSEVQNVHWRRRTVLLRSGVWNLHRAATPPSAPLALVIAQDQSHWAGVSRPFFCALARAAEKYEEVAAAACAEARTLQQRL